MGEVTEKIYCCDRGDKVYMPDGADVSVWQEITDAKKQELEAQWHAEMEAEMEVGDVQE